MVTKKQLAEAKLRIAANLARQARYDTFRRNPAATMFEALLGKMSAERDLDDLYDTFRRNPTATMFEALLGKMRAFQEAVNIQHEIARWEDE